MEALYGWPAWMCVLAVVSVGILTIALFTSRN